MTLPPNQRIQLWPTKAAIVRDVWLGLACTFDMYLCAVAACVFVCIDRKSDSHTGLSFA